MINSPYFKIVPFDSSDNQKPINSELISGDYWGIIKENDQYILRYISGDHQGGEKQLPLTDIEFSQIKNKEITIEEILRIHGAG